MLCKSFGYLPRRKTGRPPRGETRWPLGVTARVPHPGRCTWVPHSIGWQTGVCGWHRSLTYWDPYVAGDSKPNEGIRWPPQVHCEVKETLQRYSVTPPFVVRSVLLVRVCCYKCVNIFIYLYIYDYLRATICTMPRRELKVFILSRCHMCNDM